jgi:cysteinyl-tRNA synthetase
VARAEQRVDARAASDFPRSDELRTEIDALGWEVRDEAGGFRLVRKQ